MAKLYEIADEFKAALTLDVDCEDDANAFIALIDEVQAKFDDKAKNVAYYIANLNSEAAAFREEEKRLAARRQAMERRAENLKDYLTVQMRSLHLKEMEAGTFKIKFVKCPPSVKIDDPAAIPADYLKPPVEPEPDKRKILDALKNGEAVPGVEMVQDERLRIS